MVRFRRNELTVSQRLGLSEKQRARVAAWIDPFPEIHGTLPEKMVYAELSRRNIPFLFLNDIHMQVPDILVDKWYQADFIIPSANIIIEVQGAFWHSKPATVEADAYKLALYEISGYTALAWWDYDILSRLQELFAETPALNALTSTAFNFGRSSELPVQRRTKIDTSKGIRTLNERRYRGTMAKIGRRKIRKAIGFYASTK